MFKEIWDAHEMKRMGPEFNVRQQLDLKDNVWVLLFFLIAR